MSREKIKNLLLLTVGLKRTKCRLMIASDELDIPEFTVLTDRQRLFVDHYIECKNGAEAARRAGYSTKNAHRIASQNFHKPQIMAAIDAKCKIIGPDTRLTPENLRKKTADMVFDDTLKPDTVLKAIEIAGKMVPGTFVGEAPTGNVTNINIVNVTQHLTQLRRKRAVVVEKEDIVVPATIPPHLGVVNNINNPSPTLVEKTLNLVEEALSVEKINSPVEPSTPHDGPSMNNTDSNKIVESKAI